jgi:hypothetical protein
MLQSIKSLLNDDVSKFKDGVLKRQEMLHLHVVKIEEKRQGSSYSSSSG